MFCPALVRSCRMTRSTPCLPTSTSMLPAPSTTKVGPWRDLLLDCQRQSASILPPPRLATLVLHTVAHPRTCRVCAHGDVAISHRKYAPRILQSVVPPVSSNAARLPTWATSSWWYAPALRAKTGEASLTPRGSLELKPCVRPAKHPILLESGRPLRPFVRLCRSGRGGCKPK